MTDEPRPIELRVNDQSTSGERVVMHYTPFEIRLFEACHHALARLEVQTRMRSDTFTETGEVLFWLYAISNYGRPRPALGRGLRWARNRYAHGQLFTEPHKMSGSLYDTKFRVGREQRRENLAGRHPLETHFDLANAIPDPKGFQAFKDDLTARPVLATLQAEAERLLKLAAQRATPSAVTPP